MGGMTHSRAHLCNIVPLVLIEPAALWSTDHLTIVASRNPLPNPVMKNALEQHIYYYIIDIFFLHEM